MTITSTQLLTSALREIGALGVTDTLSDANIALECLSRLNGFLNGLNAKGAVFPNVDLALGDTVPISDEHEDDLRLAMAFRLCPLFGKTPEGMALAQMMKAERRFVAAHTTISPVPVDATLLNMPSQRRMYR
jgi:hypothetical protein